MSAQQQAEFTWRLGDSESEMLTLWHQQGIEEGLQEGMREGIRVGGLRGMSASILRVLVTRLGPVPASVMQVLETVTDTQSLAELTGTAASVTNFREFEAELDRFLA